ncbi:MAG: cytochrome c biogenesis CcdA family protein [Candidatus Hodarchaeales archaeon]
MLDNVLLIVMFNLGLATALSPCMFPVLPSYLAYLSSSASGVTRGLISSLLVFSGLMLVFILIAFLFSSVLGFFADHFREFEFIQGLLLVVFGLLLVFNIFISFNKINELSSSTQMAIRKFNNPYVVSFLIGITFALIAAPCAIILFFTAFSIILAETFINGVILLLSFALGAGIPFFIIGVVVPLLQDTLKSETQGPSKLTNYSRMVYKYLPRIAGAFVLILGLQLIIDSQIIERTLFA